MTKVITYGTYDLLHYGHIRLLERAKALGDYLIVGVTADDFDKTRGKINVQQSLMERIEAVKATGIADEIIIEEYEGQKIDDIRRYDIDIFTVGSDWLGKFDYLEGYCKVVYLERTEGVSSSEIRKQKCAISLGLVGDATFLNKVKNETEFVNGIQVCALCTNKLEVMDQDLRNVNVVTNEYGELLKSVDAVYIRSLPREHYHQIKLALNEGKHVLCESPLTLCPNQNQELFELAKEKGLILMEAIKTAYSTAFMRLLLLAKTGKIGEIVSVDATCTSLKKRDEDDILKWNCMFEWGPTALLPIFEILGTQINDYRMVVRQNNTRNFNHEVDFVKYECSYNHAVASMKVADGVKSEGELVVSGTKGYIYVPAPWWKTDYFEIRYENQSENKRYFYQLDGEGIRYELVAFVRAIENGKVIANISEEVSYAIAEMMQSYVNHEHTIIIE